MPLESARKLHRRDFLNRHSEVAKKAEPMVMSAVTCGQMTSSPAPRKRTDLASATKCVSGAIIIGILTKSGMLSTGVTPPAST